MFWKNLKNCKFYQKISKIRRVTCSNFLSDRRMGFLALENGLISKIDKNLREPWKKLQILSKKNAKIRDIKMLKPMHYY